MSSVVIGSLTCAERLTRENTETRWRKSSETPGQALCFDSRTVCLCDLIKCYFCPFAAGLILGKNVSPAADFHKTFNKVYFSSVMHRNAPNVVS